MDININIKETKVVSLTCNQLIFLLNMYRGTHAETLRMGTDQDDVLVLISHKLVVATQFNNNYCALDITQEGNDYINSLQAVDIPQPIDTFEEVEYEQG